MSNYDFLDIYFPDPSELDQTRMQEMRSALSTLVRSVYPQVDTSPNSPFGDLFISPGAPAAAAMEIAVNRLFSDLDPVNVEAGIAYNCDFIRQFYLNLGIHDEATQRSYGILRLVYSSAETRELDRSTTFLISDGTYRPYAPHAGAVQLLPPGLVGEAGTNYKNYCFIGENSWAVDLLVMGNAGQLAVAGAGVEVDRTIDGLDSAIALSDFQGGVTPPQLQELARRTRANFYSRTPTTRGGATNMITQQFPEITTVTCTMSGDYEMTRDISNPAQVAAGYLDILVRAETLLQDTVTIRLRQQYDENGYVIYAGWLDLPETPVKLASFINNSLDFNPEIISISEDPAAPGLSAAYGSSEKLLMRIPYQEDSTGDPMLRTSLDEDGVYVDIAVTYLFDPNLKICQEFVSGEDNIPAGMSLYVRWYVPIEVELMEVSYNRKSGTALNLEAARADILTAFNKHRFEEPAGAAIIDAAFYYAGAHSVNSVDILAAARYSVADKVWTGSTFALPDDQTSWTAFMAECSDVPVTYVTSVYNPQYQYLDTSEPFSYSVSGLRNVSYLLFSSNLKLTELRSV